MTFQLKIVNIKLQEYLKHEKNEKGILITPIVGVIAIGMMIWDFLNYPPLSQNEQGWEYINNYQESLTKHIFLVFITFFLEKILSNQAQLKYYFIILCTIYSLNLIWAGSNTIHHGGIAVIYFFWSAFLLLYVIVRTLKKKIRQ